MYPKVTLKYELEIFDVTPLYWKQYHISKMSIYQFSVNINIKLRAAPKKPQLFVSASC